MGGLGVGGGSIKVGSVKAHWVTIPIADVQYGTNTLKLPSKNFVDSDGCNQFY